MIFLNEQVPGDIHLECNSEIARLQKELARAVRDRKSEVKL
jgi:hypothetical protein